ncbi:AAA family ATPase [Archangium violaceum]|uniref:AAA family ATPase n=1 Tax=Archangium violaceum TaxID=83451 RepID=UPI0019507A5F|nr:AAA family ATPase [Archangium violaceum]QRN93866.1 AAA family ATPase [Archangium violaceum]
MDDWRIELLGRARLSGGRNGPRPLERKTAALLAYLSLEGETARGKLAGLLWPESREATARNNLSQLLRRLRELLGEPGVEGRESVRLREGLRVDVRELVRGEPSWAASPGGELLAELSYDECDDLEDWLRATRPRVLLLQQKSLEARVLLEESEGRLPSALEVAQRMLLLEPTSEEAFRLLMRLHHQLGNRSAALQVWRQCEEVLERELGTRPSTATRQLANDIQKESAPPAIPSPARRALPLAVVHPPVLAGREPEWARMEEAWEARRPIFVVGPPGVGKSRLLVDFARSRGRWLMLTARPGDFDVPYATHVRGMREMLRRNPGLVLEDWVRRELSRALPELGDEALPLPPPPEEKARFFAAVLHLARLALRELDVLAFDDAQYMDSGSSELSLYLLAQLQDDMSAGRFPLIILSQRTDETLWSGERIRQVVDAGLAEWIQLEPLAPQAVHTLLRGMELPALERMSGDIARYTGGNPLFVVETARHLFESNALEGEFPSGLPPPGRARAIIQKRLARLSPEAFRLAQVLAVARVDVGLDQAAAVLRTPAERLVDAWRELEEAALVRGAWFSHDLVGEALLAELPSSVRELLSGRLTGRDVPVDPVT